jgi:hypothetical protein
VFPNPSTGVFMVKMNEHSSKIQYQVLNQEGKLIAESTTFSDEFKIDLTNQPKGIYFLKVKTDKGIVEKKLAR